MAKKPALITIACYQSDGFKDVDGKKTQEIVKTMFYECDIVVVFNVHSPWGILDTLTKHYTEFKFNYATFLIRDPHVSAVNENNPINTLDPVVVRDAVVEYNGKKIDSPFDKDRFVGTCIFWNDTKLLFRSSSKNTGTALNIMDYYRKEGFDKQLLFPILLDFTHRETQQFFALTILTLQSLFGLDKMGDRPTDDIGLIKYVEAGRYYEIIEMLNYSRRSPSNFCLINGVEIGTHYHESYCNDLSPENLREREKEIYARLFQDNKWQKARSFATQRRFARHDIKQNVGFFKSIGQAIAGGKTTVARSEFIAEKSKRLFYNGKACLVERKELSNEFGVQRPKIEIDRGEIDNLLDLRVSDFRVTTQQLDDWTGQVTNAEYFLPNGKFNWNFETPNAWTFILSADISE